jgi:hypothetical protein
LPSEKTTRWSGRLSTVASRAEQRTKGDARRSPGVVEVDVVEVGELMLDAPKCFNRYSVRGVFIISLEIAG